MQIKLYTFIIIVLSSIFLSFSQEDTSAVSNIQNAIHERSIVLKKYEDATKKAKKNLVSIGVVKPILNYDKNIIDEALKLEVELIKNNELAINGNSEHHKKDYSLIMMIVIGVLFAMLIIVLVMYVLAKQKIKNEPEEKPIDVIKKGTTQTKKNTASESKKNVNPDLTKETRNLKADKELLQEKLDKLKERNTKNSDELYNLKIEYKDLQSELKRKNIDYNTLLATSGKTNIQTIMSNDDIKLLKQEKTDLENRVKLIESNLESKITENSLLTEKIKQISYKSEKENNEKSEKKLISENTQLRQVLKDIYDDIISFKKEKTDYIKQINELKIEERKLSLEKKLLLEKLNIIIKSGKLSQDKPADNIKYLKQNEIINELQTKNLELGEAVKEKITLTTELEKTSKEKQEIADRCYKQNGLIDELNTEKESLEEEISNKESLIENLEKEIRLNVKTDAEIEQEKIESELKLIDKLNNLKDNNALTDTEFLSLKNRIINI